jgi:hypothetical protein
LLSFSSKHNNAAGSWWYVCIPDAAAAW